MISSPPSKSRSPNHSFLAIINQHRRAESPPLQEIGYNDPELQPTDLALTEMPCMNEREPVLDGDR